MAVRHTGSHTEAIMAAPLQEQARALGDPTRHAIFRQIADSGHPVGIAELNQNFPLNHNAIRQHLAKLVAAGLVVETAPVAGRPGRPRLMYTVAPAVEGQWGTTGPYERLSRLLIEIIRTGLDAEEVGRRSAGQFQVPAPSGDAVADITAAMARQGFEPEALAVRAGTEIVLNSCPFAGVALADRHTVCALHLGIAEGLAEGTPVAVDELVAYDPRKAGCRIRLQPNERGHESRKEHGTLSLRRRSKR
jgi:predicted ArsR family transcriptional regulator